MSDVSITTTIKEEIKDVDKFDEDVDEFYRQKGYEGQADFYNKKLPIYRDFLSFEEYQKKKF